MQLGTFSERQSRVVAGHSIYAPTGAARSTNYRPRQQDGLRTPFTPSREAVMGPLPTAASLWTDQGTCTGRQASEAQQAEERSFDSTHRATDGCMPSSGASSDSK